MIAVEDSADLNTEKDVEETATDLFCEEAETELFADFVKINDNYQGELSKVFPTSLFIPELRRKTLGHTE